MKKYYEAPALRTELFDVQDAITASGMGSPIRSVAGGKPAMEVLLDNLDGVLSGGSQP